MVGNSRNFPNFLENPDHMLRFSRKFLPYATIFEKITKISSKVPTICYDFLTIFPPHMGGKYWLFPPSLKKMRGDFRSIVIFPPHSRHPVSPPYGGEKLSMIDRRHSLPTLFSDLSTHKGNYRFRKYKFE